MMSGVFDEKAVIALAFFVCVRLIIKFFGRNFLQFLSSKRSDIINNIINTENQFDLLIKTSEDLKKQEETIKMRNHNLDESAEKERQFILETAEKNSKMLLQSSLQNQKSVNKRLFEEIVKDFSKIPFEVSKRVMTFILLEERNLELQHQLIDSALDDVLNDGILDRDNHDQTFKTAKIEGPVKKVDLKKKLNVLLIGGGGREYALAWKLFSSPLLEKLFSISGSDGISRFAEQSNIDWRNFNDVLDFCKNKNIDLVIIGPEEPIVVGLSDFLRQNNILVFAPSQTGSQIESSKEFTKNICREKNIPTAQFSVFSDLKELKNWLENSSKFPIVLKYDGLAAGKGVKICQDLENALIAAEDLYQNYNENFKIIAEEFIEGHEISFFAITDCKTTKKLAFAQDYKRAFDNDEGGNTGGMGAISGDFLMNSQLEDEIMQQIIHPTVEYLNENNIEYRGVLFAGLMIDKNNQPHLLEFNARFGDPETEAIMMRFDSDLLELLYDTAKGELKNSAIEINKKHSICVVLASNGYPNQYQRNILIANSLPPDSEDCKIFHHGTKFENDGWYSIGGRVLSVNILSDDIAKMRKKAYNLIKKINWENGFYRSDIGKRYE